MPDPITRPDSALTPGHLIRRLHQLSTRVFTERTHAAGFDLTPVQFIALDTLRENAGIDQASLADAIAKDRATLGAVADRLEQKGLVTRVINPRDKRARELELTQKGREVVDAMRPIVMSLQSDILPGLTPEEYQTFIHLAAKAAHDAE